MNAVRDDLNKAIGNVDIKAEALQESLNAKALELSESIDAKTVAVSDALEASAATLGSSIKTNAKQIENLKKLAQGKIYDFETDTTSAYVKDVPTGAAPYAAMKAIGGKSIVMNQLYQIHPISSIDVSGITVTRSMETMSSSVYGTATEDISVLNILSVYNTKVVEGHKYYLRVWFVRGSYPLKSWWFSSAKIDAPNSDGTGRISVASGTGQMGMNFQTSSISSGTALDFELKLQLTDLTIMFGDGNEPTVEEFEAMFPDYIPYNEGEIVSAEVQNVKSVGKNIFSPTVLENYTTKDNCESFSIRNGVISAKGNVSSASMLGAWSKGWIFFYRNKEKQYALRVDSESYLTIGVKLKVLEDAYPDVSIGEKFIFQLTREDGNTVPVYNSTIVDGSIIYKYKVSVAGNYNITFSLSSCTVELSEFMVVKSDAIQALVPYKEDNLPIPEAVKQLEGYGWSAGSVCNEVDFGRKKFIKRVGAVDLGSLRWETESAATSGVTRLRANIANCMPCSNGAIANIICEKYETATANDTYSLRKDKIIGVHTITSGDLLYVYDSSYNTTESLSAFSDSVQGVILYYELAEPEEIDISDILTDDNLIEVEQGGTLTFENIHGDSYHLPVPSDVEYMINLQEATA